MWSIAPGEDFLKYPMFCHINTENIEYVKQYINLIKHDFKLTTCTEFSKEFFSTKRLQIVYEEGPQM